MVRTLLALKGGLVRGALAQLLAAEDGIAVIDVDMVTAEQLAHLAVTGPASCPAGARLLVLVEQRCAARLGPVLAEHGRRVGFLSRDVAPERIADGVRQLAEGRVVLDPDLVVAALEVDHSPLTPREREVLDAAAEGHPVREIAERLVLSAGTVRNHLSRVMAKTGARTRLEAVRIARESGWI